MKNNRSLL